MLGYRNQQVRMHESRSRRHVVMVYYTKGTKETETTGYARSRDCLPTVRSFSVRRIAEVLCSGERAGVLTGLCTHVRDRQWGLGQWERRQWSTLGAEVLYPC